MCLDVKEDMSRMSKMSSLKIQQGSNVQWRVAGGVNSSGGWAFSSSISWQQTPLKIVHVGALKMFWRPLEIPLLMWVDDPGRPRESNLRLSVGRSIRSSPRLEKMGDPTSRGLMRVISILHDIPSGRRDPGPADWYSPDTVATNTYCTF